MPVSTSAGQSSGTVVSHDDYNSATGSNKGTSPITAVTFGYNGGWIPGVQVKYGTTTTPWRGGQGSGTPTTLTLADGECVTGATAKTANALISVTLVTSNGQSVTWSNGINWSPQVTFDASPPNISGGSPLCLLAINVDVRPTGFTFNQVATPVIMKLDFYWGEYEGKGWGFASSSLHHLSAVGPRTVHPYILGV